MRHNHNRKASILIFTLLILSIITLLTQQLVRSVWVGAVFGNGMVAQQRARALAIGGVNLAISQLSLREIKKDGATPLGDDQKKDKQLKEFLKRILPNLNRWQVFNLVKKVDQIDGQIKICITCENGKININDAFDFKKNEFKKDFKALLEGLHIKGKFKEGEILNRLTDFLKDRKRKLDDISELINVEGLEQLDIFYRPPLMPKNKKSAEPNFSVALQDFFTTWTLNGEIELMFSSDAVSTVLGLRRPLADDAERLKDKFLGIIENFKKDWGTDWNNNWQILQPIFGKKPKNLTTLKEIFSKEFGPQVYSVLSCGIVENVEQRLLVVVKEVTTKKNNEKAKGKAQESGVALEEKKETSGKKHFKILKMYWI